MSTQGTTGPGGVKNLRAMFETKTGDSSTSPPSRGRSPNGSISSVGSRQVSKVRTSFVAVERPGEPGQPAQWGLRKASDVSSMASLREQAMPETGTAHGPGLGAIMRGSPFEGSDAQTATPVNGVTAKPAQASIPTSTRANGKTENVADRIKRLQSNESTPDSSSKPENPKPVASKETKAPPSKLTIKAPAPPSKQSPTLPRSQPTSAKKTDATPTSATSTGPAFKPRGGVNKIKGIIDSSNRAKEERAETAASSTNIKPPSVASKSTAASKARESLLERDVSPEEPKVKSPTLTTKIPSVANKTTAAAAARKEANTEKETVKPKPTERKTTVPQAPRVASANTRASLARKSSRASIAPEQERPKSSARVSNVSRAGGEDFLARMTRPTASTAQKAHDKLQVGNSPPRPRQNTTTSRDGHRRQTRQSINLSNKTERQLDEEAGPEPEAEAENKVNGAAPSESHNEGQHEAVDEAEAKSQIQPQQAGVLEGAAA